MQTSDSELLVDRDGFVMTCTINRPQRRNALTATLVDLLTEELEEADRDPGVRVICLTGSGDLAFCAGGDLASDMAGKGVEYTAQAFAKLLVTMDGLGKPLVARVNGSCMGGGLGLMLGCDMAVACQDAKFGTPEVKSGVFPMIIAPLVLRHVGPKKALEMFFTGRRYSAAQAEAMGLVNQVVVANELDRAVGDLMEEVLAAGPAAISLGRKALSRTRYMDLTQASADLAKDLVRVLCTEDAMEGISAFLEKRKPEWKGK